MKHESCGGQGLIIVHTQPGRELQCSVCSDICSMSADIFKEFPYKVMHITKL